MKGIYRCTNMVITGAYRVLMEVHTGYLQRQILYLQVYIQCIFRVLLLTG